MAQKKTAKAPKKPMDRKAMKKTKGSRGPDYFLRLKGMAGDVTG